MSEEENFPDDEEVIIGGDDDDEIVVDVSSDDEQQTPQEETSPDQQLVSSLMAKFNPKTGAARRLIYDLKEMMQSNPSELGFSTHPHGTNIFSWEVRLFGFEKGTPMFDDLKRYEKETGRGYVEMCVTFPPDYPNLPPFVRVVRPRFQFHTGRVTVGGSLCTDILTLESWNPMYDIQGLLVNVFSEIMNGKPRIDFGNPTPYSLQEARAAYQRVASDHGWKTSSWLPDK